MVLRGAGHIWNYFAEFISWEFFYKIFPAAKMSFRNVDRYQKEHFSFPWAFFFSCGAVSGWVLHLCRLTLLLASPFLHRFLVFSHFHFLCHFTSASSFHHLIFAFIFWHLPISALFFQPSFFTSFFASFRFCIFF